MQLYFNGGHTVQYCAQRCVQYCSSVSKISRADTRYSIGLSILYQRCPSPLSHSTSELLGTVLRIKVSGLERIERNILRNFSLVCITPKGVQLGIVELNVELRAIIPCLNTPSVEHYDLYFGNIVPKRGVLGSTKWCTQQRTQWRPIGATSSLPAHFGISGCRNFHGWTYS